MQLKIRTSYLDMYPITDFKYLYDLARCSKCQMFILLQSTNTLYGASDDSCSIHEIKVPFLVDSDLFFRVDSTITKIVDQYDSFFIPDKFPWVILPSYYWEMYKSGDLYAEYNPEEDRYNIFDKCTMQQIEQIHSRKCIYSHDFESQNFENQLCGFLSRCKTLAYPEIFCNVENDPGLRKAFDNKTSFGRVLCRMKNDNIDVAFSFYKGLVSLSKADTLDLEIRKDRFNTFSFMATFKPKKKKNPLKFNTYGVPFQEQIHIMFVNLA